MRHTGNAETTSSAAGEWNVSLLASDIDGDRLPPPPSDETNGGAGSTSPLRTAGAGRLRGLAGYELLHEIARGGMGVVYKARQRSLDRIVAVKMIRDGALADRQDIARFQTEAAAAARLRHPHIVAVYEVGAEGDQHFYSMDYIDGTSLAEHARQQPLPVAAAAALVGTIAEAVQAAHDEGILHRDLKPSNVLMDRSGQPHVADFGLAKRLEGGSELTGTEQILGTPGYMPPEQAVGRHDQVGFASDVYSLGAILYELLTGRPPFRGETAMATIRQVLENEPVSPRRLNPAVSRDLETICLKCLEKEPGRRYATARELAEELGRWLRGEPIAARPLGAAARGWRWCRRHPARAVAGALVLTLAIGGPTAAVWTAGLLQRAQTAETDRVQAQIQALRGAAPEAVASTVEELRRNWTAVEPQLMALWEDSSLTEQERSRVSSALLSRGDPYREFAYRRLLVAEARECNMLREALAPYRQTLIERLWHELAASETAAAESPSAGLNVAAALAEYDPEDDRWAQHAAGVADRLLTRDSLTAAVWAAHLETVRSHLIPHLCQAYADLEETRAARRALATDLLSRFVADDPELLVELLTTADARGFNILFPALQVHASRAPELLGQKLNRLLATERDADDDPRDLAAANLAVALFRTGAPEHTWSLLAHSPDQTVRTLLIHRLLPFGANAAALADRLESDEDSSVRRAIILALGEGDAPDLPRGLRERLIAHLETLFREDPDTGIHAAAEWTLRRWGQDDLIPSAREASLDRDPNSPLGRFVTGDGHVMAVVRGPVEFQSGGSTIRIERSFAFAIHELTREHYLRFHNDPQIQARLAAEQKAKNQPGRHWHNESWSQSFGPDSECPHVSIPWTVAVIYCRWLSEREGLPEAEQCFVPGPTTDDAVELRENYLDLAGYRMPTAAEFEYMCRAGAHTERHFGRCVHLLHEYAWYNHNSQQRSWPVGSLKPNDLGVFDIHGNVREWCLNSRGHRAPAEADGIARDVEESDLLIEPRQDLQTAGGSYNDHARFIRAGSRETGNPVSDGNNLNGLRLVRTLKLEEP